MGLMDFRPFLRVKIDGVPLSGIAFSQISSARVTDAPGLVSDRFEMTFANLGGPWGFVVPDPGAEIDVEMGYLFGFKNMGTFIAEEVEEEDPPKSISVVAFAKAQGSTKQGMAPIHQQKTRSWAAGMTLKAIAGTIADDNGLKLAITEAAGAIVPGHLDQLAESDLSLLTRVALAHDLIAKPAGGRLFVGKRADRVSASGQPMPQTLLRRKQVTKWRMRNKLGEGVGTVKATYRDVATAKDVDVSVGEGEPVRRLRQRYRTEAEAKEMAEIELKRSGRAKQSLSVEMPGNPAIATESSVVPLDFSAKAMGEWVVTNTVHEVGGMGYRSQFQSERPE